jgi:hypothetical protein
VLRVTVLSYSEVSGLTGDRFDVGSIVANPAKSAQSGAAASNFSDARCAGDGLAGCGAATRFARGGRGVRPPRDDYSCFQVTLKLEPSVVTAVGTAFVGPPASIIVIFSTSDPKSEIGPVIDPSSAQFVSVKPV